MKGNVVTDHLQGITISDSSRVTRWLKAPGDRVERGEALVELETDKVEVVLDCPESGILVEIAAEAGRRGWLGFAKH